MFVRSESYLINVVWSKTNEIAITWMNREQTLFVISVCVGPNWSCQDVSKIFQIILWLHGNLIYLKFLQVHIERAAENEWVDPNVDIVFSNNGSSFLTVLSVLDGGAGRFPQICHIDIATKVMTPLTHGQVVVTNIKAWDQNNNVMYVLLILFWNS